ncbi:unnamed protein product [Linum trigynum]|uniref:Uncharacterized protein n=1 Tax=Linum trigynum TaxID=586398 RepID=A0AAV2E429_9ROSI
MSKYPFDLRLFTALAAHPHFRNQRPVPLSICSAAPPRLQQATATAYQLFADESPTLPCDLLLRIQPPPWPLRLRSSQQPLFA